MPHCAAIAQMETAEEEDFPAVFLGNCQPAGHGGPGWRHMLSIMSPQAVAALRRPRHGVALAMLHGANHGAIAGRSGNSFARLRSTMLRLATSTSRAPRVKPQTYPTSWSMTPPRAACRRMVRPTANGDAYRGRLTARAGAAPGIDFLPIRMDRASWQSESLCMHGRQPPHALIGYAPVC